MNGGRVSKMPDQARGSRSKIGGTRVVFERAEPVVVAAPASSPARARLRHCPFGASANPFGSAAPNPFAGDAFGFHSPFAPAAVPAHDEVPADAPEGSSTYTLVKSSAAIPAERGRGRAAPPPSR